MKLTIKELQTIMQEQIDSMKTQIEKSKRKEYELHERADNQLLNLDAFRKETDFNFREVRTEIAELRTEMRTGFAEMQAGFAEMRTNLAAVLAYATNIDVNHEERISALEANNPH
ncbi:MAG: hypothetical protein JST89_11055 [Cyanobacteria bacterium SZAS-4]|nr:hypothetical protein [Cyanobacteria bacterium SZAS-4]